MDYEYKLICESSVKQLNNTVSGMVKEGFKPMGPHTHSKSHYADIPEPQTWNNCFCISMEKKTKSDE